MKTMKITLPLLVVLAVPLHAGVASADPAAPAQASSPATAGAAADVSQGKPVDAERMAEARRQFAAGVNLLEDPDGAKYEDAYSAFKKAYELSQSPKVLGNIGFCALHLERDGEAIDAYTTYLRDTPDVSDRERAQIQKDLATLGSTVARLVVVVKRADGAPVTKFVLVDTRSQTRGAPVENSYAFDGDKGAVRVRPGRHSLKVKIGDEVSSAVDVTIDPAASASQEIVFAPPKPLAAREVMVVRQSPSYAAPILLGSAGLVAIGAGVVTGLVAKGKTGAIEDKCPNGLCPATYDLAGARSSAKTYGTIADAAFIGGGALLGGAVLWYLLTPKGGKETGRPTPTAMCTHQGCGVQLQGGF